MVSSQTIEGRPVRTAALRVPQIAAVFWLIKALSTAFGESFSDYLVGAIVPEIAVACGFVLFVAALALQLRARRYVAWRYWLAVVGVGVFGTMVADVVHVVLGLPYTVTSVLYAVALAAVFVCWWRVEGTLSIHAIDSTRRELFYWAAVAATFAMGTALGDLTANTAGLGYAASIALFAVAILIPAVGYRWLHWNSVACFWAAYVLTRPLGASIADWLGKGRPSGVGVGSELVSILLAIAITGLVGYLTVTKSDVQPDPAAG